MAAPGAPTNYVLQTGNQQNYLSWDITTGATSYVVYRSLDGISYTLLDSPTANNYLDEDVTIGTQYWYKIAAVNGSGTGIFTAAQSIVPAPTSEMSLGQLRLSCQQKADRVNSQFVTTSEWNTFINLAMYELYDLLITAYEDYYMAPRARFNTNGNQFSYPLPDGTTTFIDQNGDSFVPEPLYKLLGVDLAVNVDASQNAFVTLRKYSLIDRNKYVFPNTQSARYGVYNPAYRMLGNKIEFIPTPSSNTTMQLLYIPRLRQLLKDTDLTTLGHSGWLLYAICRAAKYALDKEESDTSKLDAELAFLKQRIEESAMNRDAGQPDTISNTRGNAGGGWGSSTNGWDGGFGGY
jgi:hypothetical protein